MRVVWQEAEAALNVFYYLTYEDAVDVNAITNPVVRTRSAAVAAAAAAGSHGRAANRRKSLSLRKSTTSGRLRTRHAPAR
jgi:hypothetical protein